MEDKPNFLAAVTGVQRMNDEADKRLTPVHGFLPVGDDEVRDYLDSLKEGDRVIETGESCMTGRTGRIYVTDHGFTEASTCVMWDVLPPETGAMGTAVTHGTRRISDVIAAVNSIQ